MKLLCRGFVAPGDNGHHGKPTNPHRSKHAVGERSADRCFVIGRARSMSLLSQRPQGGHREQSGDKDAVETADHHHQHRHQG